MAEQWGVRPYPNLVDEFEIVSGDDADYEHIADTRGESAAYLIASAPLLRDELKWAVEYMEQYEGEVMPGWREFQERGRAALAASVPPTAAAGAGAEGGQG